MHRQYSTSTCEKPHPVRERAVRQDCVIAQGHDRQVVPNAASKDNNLKVYNCKEVELVGQATSIYYYN